MVSFPMCLRRVLPKFLENAARQRPLKRRSFVSPPCTNHFVLSGGSCFSLASAHWTPVCLSNPPFQPQLERQHHQLCNLAAQMGRAGKNRDPYSGHYGGNSKSFFVQSLFLIQLSLGRTSWPVISCVLCKHSATSLLH